MAFNIRKYLGIDGTEGQINHDNDASPIPEDLLNRLDVDINQLIGYIVEARTNPRKKPPTTPEEFKNDVNDFVNQSGLNDFYGPNDPQVQKLAEKASELLKDPNYLLNDLAQVAEVVRFCLYDITLYCDDSSSMTLGNRINTQVTFVERLARLILPMDGGLINLRFINAHRNAGWDNMRAVDAIAMAVRNVPYTSSTPIGTNLRSNILEPMLYQKINSQTIKRPLCVIVITDGWPNMEDPDHFRNVIAESIALVTKWRPKASKTAIKYQVNQIGKEDRATSFIEDIFHDVTLKDNVYCTSEKLDDKIAELKANEAGLDQWIVDILSKAITGTPKPKKPKKTAT